LSMPKRAFPSAAAESRAQSRIACTQLVCRQLKHPLGAMLQSPESIVAADLFMADVSIGRFMRQGAQPPKIYTTTIFERYAKVGANLLRRNISQRPVVARLNQRLERLIMRPTS
jgi:hypothetical protein